MNASAMSTTIMNIIMNTSTNITTVTSITTIMKRERTGA